MFRNDEVQLSQIEPEFLLDFRSPPLWSRRQSNLGGVGVLDTCRLVVIAGYGESVSRRRSWNPQLVTHFCAAWAKRLLRAVVGKGETMGPNAHLWGHRRPLVVRGWVLSALVLMVLGYVLLGP